MQITLDVETIGDPKAVPCLGPVKVPGTYKKQDSIDAFIEAAEAERLDKLALDPHACKLVALGLKVGNDGEPFCNVVTTHDDEHAVLCEFRDIYKSTPDVQLITFNGFKFDLLVLAFRAIVLGVTGFPILNTDRYRSQHIDLWARLSANGMIAAHSLRYYCKYLDVPFADDVTGKDIAGLVAEGRLDDVRTHCLCDVVATYALAKRLPGIVR